MTISKSCRDALTESLLEQQRAAFEAGDGLGLMILRVMLEALASLEISGIDDRVIS